VKVQPGKIKAFAWPGNAWNLRAFVTATALRAQGDPAHPFAVAARTSPDLLNDLNAIADAGGRAGHSGGAAETQSAAEAQVAKVYDVLLALLGAGGSHPLKQPRA
jgi:hypothetical protein